MTLSKQRPHFIKDYKSNKKPFDCEFVINTVIIPADHQTISNHHALAAPHIVHQFGGGGKKLRIEE